MFTYHSITERADTPELSDDDDKEDDKDDDDDGVCVDSLTQHNAIYKNCYTEYSFTLIKNIVSCICRFI